MAGIPLVCQAGSLYRSLLLISLEVALVVCCNASGSLCCLFEAIARKQEKMHTANIHQVSESSFIAFPIVMVKHLTSRSSSLRAYGPARDVWLRQPPLT